MESTEKTNFPTSTKQLIKERLIRWELEFVSLHLDEEFELTPQEKERKRLLMALISYSQKFLQTHNPQINIQKGMSVKAFDGVQWSKSGDAGDNSQFFKNAVVEDFRFSYNKVLGHINYVADIRWEHNDQISKGHFLETLKSINNP